ncbi:major facilitator superfamily domain-containing protein [Talaromyces proteolyticus]|uniref:Major facilitator superfamily domain-containing protein n=1 Tax=Talaromyces proteolyticus TaxID=1131652 RepID=A0AAD4PZ55_9EURO|nr:major facilitator superfamily domain-containing protein [Talaromyces proteolyticus]KAH8696067.1 major facilitator superfamily domain-containing protein [Talaromyces proteolyticus]
MALSKSEESVAVELENVPTDSIAITDDDYRLKIHTKLAIIALAIAYTCSSVASIGPGTTISQVTSDLGDQKVQSWIANVILLPQVGFHPVWGQLSDRFGKKWFIVAGCAFGIIGSVVAGSATKTTVVIGAQALNGLGCSLVLLGIPAGLEITPAKYRAYTMAVMIIINNVLVIATQLSAGAFANMPPDGWRWVYHYSTIFWGLGGLGAAFFYHPPPTRLRRESTVADEFRSIDFAGIALLLSGVVLLVTALTWGGNSYPWKSVQVLPTLIIGSALLIAFCLWGMFIPWPFYLSLFMKDTEAFGTRHGIIDSRFLETRNFLLLLATVFVDGALLYGISTYFPIEVNAIFSDNPFQTNINLLPYTLPLMLGCIVPAYILAGKGHYRTYLTGSLVVISIFCGLLTLVTPSRHAMALVFLGIIGFGSGGPSMLPVVLVSYSVPEFLLGTASTVMTSTRALGGIIGITIFTAIYSNALSTKLPTAVAEAAIEAGLPNSSLAEFLPAFLEKDANLLTSISGVTTQVLVACTNAAKSASAVSFQNVWFVNMAFGLLAAILSMFLLSVKHRMTNHIESALEPGKLRDAQFQISADVADKPVTVVRPSSERSMV